MMVLSLFCKLEVLQSAHIRHKPPAKPEILISSPEGRTEATTLPPGEQLRNHRYREVTLFIAVLYFDVLMTHLIAAIVDLVLSLTVIQLC